MRCIQGFLLGDRQEMPVDLLVQFHLPSPRHRLSSVRAHESSNFHALSGLQSGAASATLL